MQYKAGKIEGGQDDSLTPLRNETARLQALVDLTAELYLTTNRDGIIETVSSKLLARFDPGGTGLTGRSVFDIIAPADQADFGEVFSRCIGTSGPLRQSVSLRLIDATGKLVNVETRIKAFGGHDPGAGLAVHFREIPECPCPSGQFSDEGALTDMIINSLPGLFYMFRETGEILRWNRNFENVSGYSPDEIKNMVPLDFVAPEDREAVGAAISQTFATGYVAVQGRFYSKLGKAIPHIFSGCRMEVGGKPCLIGMGIDVSEQLAIQQNLEESETRFRTFFRSINDALFVQPLLDEGFGKFTEVNEIVCKRYGYSREELLEMTPFDVTVREEAETRSHPDYRARLKAEGANLFETIHIDRSGRHFPVEISSNVIEMHGQRMILSVVRDISERKEAEKALRDSEQQFRNLYENALVGMFRIMMKDGRFYRCNDATARLFGFSTAEELLKSGIAADSYSPPEVKQDLVGQLKQYGYISGFEWPMTLPGGKPRYLSLSAKYNCEYGCIEGVAIDITERKLLEEQLRQTQKLEAIGTLTGGIAHDFNNILFAILSNAEIAKGVVAGASTAAANIDQIIESANRAAALVRQLLAFSRPSSHSRDVVSIQAVMDEVEKLIRAILPTTIKIQVTTDDPGLHVSADVTELHQVILNLCTNAGQAMEKSGGKLQIKTDLLVIADEDPAWSDLKPGDYARIRVSDTGHGMTEDTIERIFEPFFTTREVGKGTGLGLSVVHGIVTGLEGAIKVDSEPYQGSTFTVLLPAARAQAGCAPEADAIIPQGEERVLLVDDEGTIVRIMTKIVSSLGYKVTAFSSSLEALNEFEADPDGFDLVITDQTMPDMTGDQLCQRVTDIKPGLPVIIMTGYSQHLPMEKAVRHGAREYLMKPVRMQDLATAIRRALDN